MGRKGGLIAVNYHLILSDLSSMIHIFMTNMADKKRWFTLFFGLDGYWYYAVSKIKKALISSVRPNDRYQNYVVDEVEKTLISAVSFSALFVWLYKKIQFFNVKVKNLKTLQPSKNIRLQHVHNINST